MALDDLFVQIGEFGRYQWYMFLLAASGTILCPVALFSQLFYYIYTPHWCNVDAWDDSDCYGLDPLQCLEAKRNVSIPWKEEGGFSECAMYNVSGLEFDHYLDPGSLNITKCENGWIFDEEKSGRTLTAKFSLVCERETLVHLSNSLYFVGSLIGNPFYGSLSDRIGRKYAWGVSVIHSIVCAILILFINNFWMYCILRIIAAMSNYALWTLPFVYITEIVGYNKRMFAGLLVEFFWAAGYLTITAIAWIIKDWVYIQIFVIGFHVLALPLVYLLPESPRWLIATGRTEEAETILKVIAKSNGRPLPSNFKEEIVSEGKLTEENSLIQVSPKEIFLNRTMLLWLSIFMVIWFGHGITYYGLTFISSSLGIPFYPSFFVQAAVEVPAYIFCIILVRFVGRRYPSSIFMVAAGVSCILALFMPRGVWQLLVVVVAKFAISVSFVIVYVYATEIFPTEVRGFGLCLLTVISITGEIISPLVLILADLWPPFPLVLCSISVITGGFLALLLPETKGTMLPETIEEAVALGKKMKKIPSEDFEETKT